jgi:murein DD-endopeptidase MepM/ murein hydrolase activator NlpD
VYECLIQGGAARSQGFGCTGISIEPRCGTCTHYHSGWDLASACGREVYASCDGTVVAIGDDPGYGPFALFILRAVDGLVELYGHLQDATVRPGDHVYTGQVIGHVGTFGNSTGCHLHWSIRQAWARLDECASLDPGPFMCSCAGVGGPAPTTSQPVPLSGGAILLLLGAGPRLGLITSSPAAPGLGR